MKTQTGDTLLFMTDSIMNNKYLDCALDPAKAIECDMFTYYQLSGTCWVWGSGLPFQFQNMNVPFEFAMEDCDLVNPDSITGMTLAQYVDFIYMSNVHIPARKTTDQSHTAFHYHELRRIYINYYLMSEPDSNSLNVKKLESFLELIEANFFLYSEQFIPATSILRAQGTVYRNTVFNRQRFVYREGINAGSEFRIALPVSAPSTGITVSVNSELEDIPEATLVPVEVTADVCAEITVSVIPVVIDVEVVSELSDTIYAFSVELDVGRTDEVAEYIETIEGV